MTHSQNQNLQTKTIIGFFIVLTILYWACGTDTNVQAPVQPQIVAPEEWEAISHDSTHPTPLNAWIDSKGVVQTEFQ